MVTYTPNTYNPKNLYVRRNYDTIFAVPMDSSAARCPVKNVNCNLFLQSEVKTNRLSFWLDTRTVDEIRATSALRLRKRDAQSEEKQ